MEELNWNIRKMRKEQKQSTTRNTYKQSKDEEFTRKEATHIAKRRGSHFSKFSSFFDQIKTSLMLILEEG